MSDPRFSVVIPTYNRGKEVFAALDSMLRQDYGNIEILIVDDGSTDNTQELFRKYRNPKVTYLRKENGERGAARNFGAARASGDYVNFFDSDDYVYPDYFREAANAVKSLNRPEVFAMGLHVRDAAGTITETFENLPDPLNDLLLKGNIFGCGGVFIRKDIFDRHKFEENRALAGTEDWLLWLVLCARYPFRFWNRIVWAYIDHGKNSVYRFTEKELNQRTELLMKCLQADPEFVKEYGQELGRILAFRYTYNALHLALSGRIFSPLRYLAKSFRTDIRGAMRRTTLGALKRVSLNLIAKR